MDRMREELAQLRKGDDELLESRERRLQAAAAAHSALTQDLAELRTAAAAERAAAAAAAAKHAQVRAPGARAVAAAETG